MRGCVVDDCGRSHYARGWCSKHYHNYRRRGIPALPRLTLIDRVMAKVDKAGPLPATAPELGPCWIWTAHLNRTGYGQVNRGATEGRALVHRVVYEHKVGPIPDGLELDHLCRNPACCNPAHLEPVTHAENVRRGRSGDAVRQRAAERTHCVNGHPYQGENVKIQTNGRRRCRACVREWTRRKKAATQVVLIAALQGGGAS